MWRRADLRKIARHRQDQLGIPRTDFVRLIAETLDAAPRGPVRLGKYPSGASKIVTWPGLDMISLKEEVARCHLGAFSDDELAFILDTAHGWRSAEQLGKTLKLTAAERRALPVRTIEANDEPKAKRQQRVAAGRRDRDRDAYRVKHGAKPREVYLEAALSRQKPWKAAGISKRTWYRHRNLVANAAAPVANGTSPRRTHYVVVNKEGRGPVPTLRRSANGAAVLTLTAAAGASPTAPQRGSAGKSAPEAPTPSILTTEPLIQVVATSGSAENLDFETAKKFRPKNENPRGAGLLAFALELEPPSPDLVAAIEKYRDAGGPLPDDVQRLVRDKRRAEGITQGQLARQLLIARPTIANVEAGRYVLGKPPRIRLCEWLMAA